MKFLLHTFTTLAFVVLHSEHAFSSPLPKAHHEIHVNVGAATSVIDSIFQIPIQTLSAVGNLIKNVHTAKRNFISINVNVDHPSSAKPHPTKPATKPTESPDSNSISPDSFRPESETATSGEIGDTTISDQAISASSAAPPGSQLTDRIRPSPPPSKRPVVQPLSLDVGGGVNPLDKETTREKYFKDYVAKRLAEKNLQTNRISNTI